MSILMLGVVQLAIALPPSDIWSNADLGAPTKEAMQHAFEVTFYFPGKLLFASMLAYLVAQLFDVHLYHFWWRVTRGRHMWVRNNGSTMISQLVDTTIVNSIFLRWAWGMSWSDIFKIIVAVYLCKVVLALVDTPLIYVGRWALRRFIGIDHDGELQEAPLA